MALSSAEVSQKDLKFLDLTSLTVKEFEQILPVFEEKFHDRMKYFRLDGKPRLGREYRTYINCPLPTPEDRLLFILVYIKNNPLQVLQGELFDMPQNKANQWIHTLLPVLLATMRSLGDAPARSLEELAKRIGQHVTADISSTPSNADDAILEQTGPGKETSPLFAMMEWKGVFNVQKIRMNRRTTIVARKNVIQ
jgi:hypothetical protein